jgi:Domain of unknown function (DUF4136)
MLKSALILTLALALGGCAAMRRVDSEVSTYSQWPAERKPATYAFERLPSQQARATQQQMVEDAARAAIEAAGFTPATDPASADVNVQLGARIDGVDRTPYYDDPFWWHAGLHRWRGSFNYSFGYSAGFGGSAFGMRWAEPPTYEREVMLLLRDRQSGQALYEAHASNSSAAPVFGSVMPALFEAALKDFPNGGVNPRRVSVELGTR